VKAVRQEYSRSGYRCAVRAIRRDAELQGRAVKTHLQLSGGAVNEAAIREKDTAFACLEQTDEVSPICNVGADYRRSNPGNVCSSRTQFRWSSATLVGMRLCYKMCLSFDTRLMPGHRFGAFRRPAAVGLLLRIARPFGVSVPPRVAQSQ
jgi:hypothetical protein